MVFPWDKTSRTGRDTGFSYTCAVNLELWIKVNKIAEVGDTGETFFTFTFITHKRQQICLPSFGISNKSANNNNTIQIFTLRKIHTIKNVFKGGKKPLFHN